MTEYSQDVNFSILVTLARGQQEEATVGKKEMTVREWVKDEPEVFDFLSTLGFRSDEYRLITEHDLTRKLSIWERLVRRFNTPFVQVTAWTDPTGALDHQYTACQRARMRGLNPTTIHTKGKGWKNTEDAKPSDVLGNVNFLPWHMCRFFLIRI